MKLSEEIEILEKNMFDSIHGAYVSIEKNKRDDAKAYIATVEILNSKLRIRFSPQSFI